MTQILANEDIGVRSCDLTFGLAHTVSNARAPADLTGIFWTAWSEESVAVPVSSSDLVSLHDFQGLELRLLDPGHVTRRTYSYSTAVAQEWLDA